MIPHRREVNRILSELGADCIKAGDDRPLSLAVKLDWTKEAARAKGAAKS